MTDEQKQAAQEIMRRVPKEVKRSLRDANGLVGLLAGLTTTCLDDVDEQDSTIRVSCAALESALRIGEHLRDKVSVIAQQVRMIMIFIQKTDVWKELNGDVDFMELIESLIRIENGEDP